MFVANYVQKGEVEMEIHVVVEEKNRKRRAIENAVDSQIKNWPVLYVEDVVCSK